MSRSLANESAGRRGLRATGRRLRARGPSLDVFQRMLGPAPVWGGGSGVAPAGRPLPLLDSAGAGSGEISGTFSFCSGILSEFSGIVASASAIF